MQMLRLNVELRSRHQCYLSAFAPIMTLKNASSWGRKYLCQHVHDSLKE